jgi:hypothetical protein
MRREGNEEWALAQLFIVYGQIKFYMQNSSLPIQLDYQGARYEGWATPSNHVHEDGSPKSYYLVLNHAPIGNIIPNRGNGSSTYTGRMTWWWRSEGAWTGYWERKHKLQ